MRQLSEQKFCNQKFGSFVAMLLLATALLAGCGSGGPTGNETASPAAGGSTGGSGGSAALTIAGTAATGAPLVGATVTAKDKDGKTASGTTAADGSFSIAVTGMTPPFMLVAVPVSGSNLYSVLPALNTTSATTTIVNITPITTLVMYELNGGADPSTMYNGLTFTSVSFGAVTAKETVVRSKLPVNSVNPVFSMMYDKFTAQAGGTDPYDKALDALGRVTAISAAGVTLTSTTGASTTYASTANTGGGTSSTSTGPSITLKLTDTITPFATRTSISTSSPALLTATVTNSSGAAVPNVIVTFAAADPLLGAFAGSTNTALTDSSGVASLTFTTPSTSGGASTVSASATVAGTLVSTTLNYSIGNTTLKLSNITFSPAGDLSAYGTASVSVDVLSNGTKIATPMTVNFSSACASSGKATLTSSVTTKDGTATASYLDNGCGNTDSVSATLAGGPTVSGSIKVNAPDIGSIQFVSVAPALIALKGTGGTGRSEAATVTFRVVDKAGNAKGGVPVTFDLSTRVGGLGLGSDVSTSGVVTPGSVNSDPVTGNVVTTVSSGIVSTTVRVLATAPGTTGTLSTLSDRLLVSTGIPSQDGFSLSASIHNIEGWSIDGVTTTLVLRAADHFHNPVPDGTAISFTSEGGAIQPGCTTVDAVCSSVLTSQAFRPSNGRVTVLARAIGEEAFIDTNGNGVADNGEMIDGNNVSTDIGEAYVDYNENGIFDAATEPYFDFNVNGKYDGPDGKYEGLLCTKGAAICGAQSSIDVRASQIIVFSTSSANITVNGGAAIALPKCNIATGPGAAVSVTITVVDQHGNAMPAGTKVDLVPTNGTVTSATSYTISDTSACRIGNDPSGTAYACPAPPTGPGSATFGDIVVSMKSDAVFTAASSTSTTDSTTGVTTTTTTPATCIDSTGSGVLTVNVTSPKGFITTSSVAVTEP